MTIAEARQNCKAALSKVPRDILIISVFVLTASASFGLGFMAGQDAGLAQGQGSQTAHLLGQTSKPGVDGEVVASKSGTKYYAPDCRGAMRITEANRVWFVSGEAAQAAGYTAASSCN